MLDLGWTELLVIGVVALIVVGPKDLPGMFRTVGNFVGKAKRMAREFSQAMNDAADDAGMSDVQKTFRAAANPMKSAMDEVKKSTESFTKATMESGKPKLSPERAEAAEKIRQKTAEVALERQAKEKAAKDAAASDPAANSSAKAATSTTNTPKPKTQARKTTKAKSATPKTATPKTAAPKTATPKTATSAAPTKKPTEKPTRKTAAPATKRAAKSSGDKA